MVCYYNIHTLICETVERVMLYLPWKNQKALTKVKVQPIVNRTGEEHLLVMQLNSKFPPRVIEIK